MRKNLLSTALTLSLLFTPAIAMADGIIKLQPLQNGYQSSYQQDYYNVYGPNDTISLRGHISQIPKGTLMMIRMDQPVSTYGARLGDPISATLENDVFVNDSVAIPAGSQVLGQVANVKEAGRLGVHGEVDIRFSSIKLSDGHTIPFRGHIVTTDDSGILKGDTYTKDVLKGVGIAAGGTGVGTLMGTAAGSLIGSAGAGALFGLGVGALGGMGYALARKGKDVVIPADSRMSIIIDQPVSVGQ